MNIRFSKKLFSLVILGLLSPTSVYAADKKECNSTDNLQGWGIWCGIDTFLSQQEPTAAGPVDGNNPTLNLPTVDGNEFGGSINSNSYNWTGYAYVNVNNTNVDNQNEMERAEPNTYLTGILQLQLEPETDTINVLMTLEDGSQITFNQQAQFITPQYGPDSTYGEFQVVSEDGKYQIITAINSDNFKSRLINNDSVTSGEIRNLQSQGMKLGGFVAGSPTPLSDMSNLAVNNMQASYSGYGDYSSSYYGQMRSAYNTINVNFGNASWQGSWSGMSGMIMGSMNAQGDITGNTFSSTSISSQGYMFPPQAPIGGQIPVMVPENPAITGSIKGTFNGANAGYLTGLVDITSNGENIVGTFVNQKMDNMELR